MTDFEYIKQREIINDRPQERTEALIEIAFQLKRIADQLESWNAEGCLGTFECNSGMKPLGRGG